MFAQSALIKENKANHNRIWTNYPEVTTRKMNDSHKVRLFSPNRESALKMLLEKEREEAAEDLEVDEAARQLIADQTHRLRNTHALRRVTQSNHSI